ncbi:MAG: hypothetical protein NC293_04485 [Roseburia sp.]|nr:hypothetical protein [Roseburia sp.]
MAYKNAKMLTEGSGWVFETDRLGAPFGAKYYDFMPDSLENADVVIMKVFSFFTNDPVLIINLTSFFLFFLIAMTAYYALRQMGVRNDIAVFGAVVFDFMYYHFTRLVNHFSLGAYEFVPLSILLCVWLWQDDQLLSFGKGFFRYKKNYLVILFALLIANNGIAYYPFFTCMFLGITGVSKAIKEKKWQPLAKMLSMIMSIVLFLLIALLPSLFYQIKNGFQLTMRTVGDSETYALKIVQLLVPYKDYGIDKLRDFHEQYYNSFPFTEAHMSYLGFVAGAGFLLLLFAVFYNWKKNEDYKKNLVRLLMELNLFAVLFATMGGFSSIFANFVTGLIRAVNRISIFLGFIGIAAFCILMTKFVKHKFIRFKKLKAVGYIVFIGLVVVGLRDQIPEDVIKDSAILYIQKDSDREFIRRIENQLPEGAMIYQLPYHPYPEGGTRYDMHDYHLLTGFLYSDTLRWSYGGGKGRKGDEWNQLISGMESSEMIRTLKEEGFAGLYVDRRAYSEEEFSGLYASLNECLGHEPICSQNSDLYFWKF